MIYHHAFARAVARARADRLLREARAHRRALAARLRDWTLRIQPAVPRPRPGRDSG